MTEPTLRCAVFVRDYRPTDGGAWVMQSTILEGLARSDARSRFVFLCEGEPPDLLKNGSVEVLRLDPAPRHGFLPRVSRKLFGTEPPPSPRIDRACERSGASVVWFIGGFEETSMPYVYTLFDLEHRKHPLFPEVRSYGWTWDERERFFSRVLGRAATVVCGTDEGRREALAFYRLYDPRVRTIPLPTPGDMTDSSAPGAGLAKKYLLYPAQGWPHKNHSLLLDALPLLDSSTEILLTGDEKENMQWILERRDALGLTTRLDHRSFVSRAELRSLYRHAHALVFPCFFGPDNLPPLEAMAVGCPVLTADIPGARDQLGDAALYFDPRSPSSLAKAAARLDRDDGLRQSLIERGRVLAASRNGDTYAAGMLEVLNDLEPYLRCWDPSKPDRYRA